LELARLCTLPNQHRAIFIIPVCRALPHVAALCGSQRAAKHLQLTHQVSFWDAMILAACLDAGINLLYSEDIPGGNVSGVAAVNPFK
jgi:predicted nucleic acid-binding protein